MNRTLNRRRVICTNTALAPQTPGCWLPSVDLARTRRQSKVGPQIHFMLFKVSGLIDAANKVHQMTPQIINAGKIRLHNSSTDVDQHFDNLRREYADALNRLRDFVDDAIETGSHLHLFCSALNLGDFVRASETAMRKHTNYCEDAIHGNQPQQMVENTSQIARLGNRVLMAAKNEADNSEEPSFVQRVNTAASQLHSGRVSEKLKASSTFKKLLCFL